MSKRATVVNIHETSAYDVYVGRAGHGHDGYYGNPCIRNAKCPVCRGVHSTPGGTVDCFEEYARERIASDPEYKQRVAALHGKVLGCFCKPGHRCHGQVLAQLAAELNEEH